MLTWQVSGVLQSLSESQSWTLIVGHAASHVAAAPPPDSARQQTSPPVQFELPSHETARPPVHEPAATQVDPPAAASAPPPIIMPPFAQQTSAGALHVVLLPHLTVPVAVPLSDAGGVPVSFAIPVSEPLAASVPLASGVPLEASGAGFPESCDVVPVSFEVPESVVLSLVAPPHATASMSPADIPTVMRRPL
jgi:hypothetical protein